MRSTFFRSGDKNERRGAAMVEMAIVLPLFMLVIFSIVEFGRAMMISQLVTNAARLGSRQAILDGSTNSAVETAVKDFMQQSVNVNGSKVKVTIEIDPDPANEDPGNQLNKSTAGDLITVNVAVPFDEVALIPGSFLKGKNVVGVATMRRE